MRPKRQAYTRKTPSLSLAVVPLAVRSPKKTDITEDHFIRIKSKVGTGIFRDGMTVGEYLRAARSRDVAIRQIAVCLKAKAISVEDTLVPLSEPDALP